MKRTLRILALVTLIGVSGLSWAGPTAQRPVRTDQSAPSIFLRLKAWLLPRSGAPAAGTAKPSKTSSRRAMDCFNGHDLPPGYGCPPI